MRERKKKVKFKLKKTVKIWKKEKTVALLQPLRKRGIVN
jgi:hypothetical protein